MVGVLIVAHGALGESLIHGAMHVLGTRPAQLAQIGLSVQDQPEDVLRLAQSLIDRLDEGDGVLVLADMCGATPCNVACRLQAAGGVEVVAGVSLPMLVRALTYRNEPLAQVLSKALSGGTEGVIHLTPDTCNVETPCRHCQ